MRVWHGAKMIFCFVFALALLGTAPSSVAAAEPQIQILSPKEGTRLQSGTVEVEFTSQGLQLGDATGNACVSLQVDGAEVSYAISNGKYPIPVGPGDRIISAVLLRGCEEEAAVSHILVHSFAEGDEALNGQQQEEQTNDKNSSEETKDSEDARKQRLAKSYNVGERKDIARPTGKPRVMILFPREGQELVQGVEKAALTYAVDGIFRSGFAWAKIMINGQFAAQPEVVPKNMNPNSYDEYIVGLEGVVMGPTFVEIQLLDAEGRPLPDCDPVDVNFEVVSDHAVIEEEKAVPLCPPDIYGSNCDHDLRRNTSFLPPPLGGFQSSALAASSPRIFRALQSLIDETDCVDNSVVAEIPGSGLGAQMLFVALALTKAFNNGQNLVVTGKWLYGMHDGCPSGGLGCVFSNSFQCPTRRDLTPSRISEPANFAAPTQFEELGVFWWRAHLLEFIMHPRDELRARVALTKRMLGWPKNSPVVAVHVRHGDWCTDVYQMNLHHGTLQPCHPFSVYLAAVREMKAKYGVRHAYLSTNDENIVAEAKKVTDIHFLSVDFDRSQFHSRWGLEQMMVHGTVDRKTVAESALVDILLLRECDYFVGGFKSQFARVSFAMMAVRLGELPPYVSVDNPWFAHDQIFLLLAHFGYKVEVEEITKHLVASNWSFNDAVKSIEAVLKQ